MQRWTDAAPIEAGHELAGRPNGAQLGLEAELPPHAAVVDTAAEPEQADRVTDQRADAEAGTEPLDRGPEERMRDRKGGSPAHPD